MQQTSTTVQHGEELDSTDCTKFRRCVGKMMCISGERPHTICNPYAGQDDVEAIEHAQVKQVTVIHLASYLNGTVVQQSMARRQRKADQCSIIKRSMISKSDSII